MEGVKLLLETKTYQVGQYLADVVFSASGSLLAMDVRTANGGRVLPGMAALSSVVRSFALSGVITKDEEERFSE